MRVFNEEVIPTLRAAGAELLESINPRDVANGWSADDPSIPNFSIQDVVAQLRDPSTLDPPSTTTGLLPSKLDLFFGAAPFPDVINFRKLANTPAGISASISTT
ncbi:MAG: hypothetical protein ACJ8F1_14535 [Polyangia bacterium]